jgi:hypothetical protein
MADDASVDIAHDGVGQISDDIPEERRRILVVFHPSPLAQLSTGQRCDRELSGAEQCPGGDAVQNEVRNRRQQELGRSLRDRHGRRVDSAKRAEFIEQDLRGQGATSLTGQKDETAGSEWPQPLGYDRPLSEPVGGELQAYFVRMADHGDDVKGWAGEARELLRQVPLVRALDDFDVDVVERLHELRNGDAARRDGQSVRRQPL